MNSTALDNNMTNVPGSRRKTAKPVRGPSTQAVHAGAQRHKAYHALTEPIVQAATYTFTDTRALCDFMDDRMWGLQGDRIEYGRTPRAGHERQPGPALFGSGGRKRYNC